MTPTQPRVPPEWTVAIDLARRSLRLEPDAVRVSTEGAVVLPATASKVASRITAVFGELAGSTHLAPPAFATRVSEDGTDERYVVTSTATPEDLIACLAHSIVECALYERAAVEAGRRALALAIQLESHKAGAAA